MEIFLMVIYVIGAVSVSAGAVYCQIKMAQYIFKKD